MVITLLLVPLLNCHCAEYFEYADACNSCQQDGPSNLCEQLCLGELEYYASEEGYQKAKVSCCVISFRKESLFPKIDLARSSGSPIFYAKPRSHINFRVIQV
jgi:hypothetical protein